MLIQVCAQSQENYYPKYVYTKCASVHVCICVQCVYAWFNVWVCMSMCVYAVRMSLMASCFSPKFSWSWSIQVHREEEVPLWQGLCQRMWAEAQLL